MPQIYNKYYIDFYMGNVSSSASFDMMLTQFSHIGISLQMKKCQFVCHLIYLNYSYMQLTQPATCNFDKSGDDDNYLKLQATTNHFYAYR
jgi:hypothetical protein